MEGLEGWNDQRTFDAVAAEARCMKTFHFARCGFVCDISCRAVYRSDYDRCVVVQGFYTCLKLLVQRSGQPGLPDNDKVTPCHLATQRGSNKCLALLIKHLSSEALNAEDCNKVSSARLRHSTHPAAAAVSAVRSLAYMPD